jgi:hypothetical protein
MSREDDLEALREKLWLLPPDERCAMLILSVTELDQDALAAPLNLIGVVEKMGQQLPPHCQSVLAGRHRLAA